MSRLFFERNSSWGRGSPWAAKVATGKTLHDLRGTFATRLMHNGFEDRAIDEVLGWETGKSARIRRVYISRKAVVISAIERMRKRDKD